MGEVGSADGEGVEGIRRWTNSGTVEGKRMRVENKMMGDNRLDERKKGTVKKTKSSD